MPTPLQEPFVYRLTLTVSQRMALIDVITHVMTGPSRLEVFVDVVNQIETTPLELLDLVLHAEEVHEP